jgi:hypothetical protein
MIFSVFGEKIFIFARMSIPVGSVIELKKKFAVRVLKLAHS